MKAHVASKSLIFLWTIPSHRDESLRHRVRGSGGGTVVFAARDTGKSFVFDVTCFKLKLVARRFSYWQWQAWWYVLFKKWHWPYTEVIAAIPFGQPTMEKLSLNHDSLWSGGPFENDVSTIPALVEDFPILAK
jgi:hypothetical protein